MSQINLIEYIRKTYQGYAFLFIVAAFQKIDVKI